METTMGMKAEMNMIIGDSFAPLLDDESPYLIMYGGAGSGKSEFAARKIFYRCMKEGGHTFLVLRKVNLTCKESVVSVIKLVLDENEVPYKYNLSTKDIGFYSPTGEFNRILFAGLDDPEKIKSIKGITSVWMEEATEFNERDFVQIDLRLREPTPFYKQIMMTFNPDEAQAKWLKNYFFDNVSPDMVGKFTLHHSTIFDNPIEEIRKTYVEKLMRLKDPTTKKIYLEGLWAEPKGRIFNWDIRPLPSDWKFRDIFYGGDFGFSVDPAVLIKIYRRADEIWVAEKIYETDLTNRQLGGRIKQSHEFDFRLPEYWDSADPKAIQELKDAGIYALPASKGPDSVRAGIDFLRSLTVHITPESSHIIKENARYKWKEDKDGHVLNEPVPFEDHCMDAIRYGVYTHLKAAGFGLYVGKEAVY